MRFIVCTIVWKIKQKEWFCSMIIVEVPSGVDADDIVEDINLNEKYIHAEVKYISWSDSDCLVLKSFVKDNKTLSNVLDSCLNYKCYECGEDEPEFELEYVYGERDK